MKTEAVVAELEENLEKTKAAMARLREKSSKVADATMGTVATIGGGAVGGWLAGNYADKTILGLPPQTVLGGAATLLGVFGYAGTNSGLVASFGEGALAFDVGYRVLKKAEEKKRGAVPALPAPKVSGEVGALPQGGGQLVTLQSLYDQFEAYKRQAR